MKCLPPLLTLGMLLSACSGQAPESAADPVALVKTAVASLGAPAETVTVYGAASAGPASERGLSAPVESIIRTIYAPQGSVVGAGDPVVSLSPSPGAALELGKAANEAAQAGAAYARAKRLRADGLMSDADVESARALATTAAATRASLAGRAGGLVLRASVRGTVQMISGAPGDLVAAGAPVARIAAEGGARARFGIDPALARRISPGAAIRISPAADATSFTVPVSSIDPVADPVTRLASLYAPLPAQAEIASGETLRATVIIGRRSGVVTIPYAALLDDSGETFVFTVEKGVARRQVVMTGAEDAGLVEIRSGLGAGAVVVTAGGTALEDGMKIRVGK
jgi:RND family efflux transporter MFP subunit